MHLDIKPSNIIMGAPARLIDLSVARSIEAAASLRHPIGTDAYMAPEQCEPPATGTVGWEMASSSDALAKEPHSATLAKMAQASRSGNLVMSILE